MPLPQQEIEQATEYLIEHFGDDYPWRWEAEKHVRLSEFASNKKEKIFVLGAGSNTLFTDQIYDGVVIKLSKNFLIISSASGKNSDDIKTIS